jgi:hypothetical protein
MLSAHARIAVVNDSQRIRELNAAESDAKDFEIEPFELGRGLWHAKVWASIKSGLQCS